MAEHEPCSACDAQGLPASPRRPVLRWHGGKWKLAPKIIPYFPPHRVYVEPYGGAASVLLRKPRSYAEVYNDLDDMAVNLFRCLRTPDLAVALINVLRLTPFARTEFELANIDAGAEGVELARRLVIRSFMGFGSNAHSSSPGAKATGFRSTGFRANSSRSGTTPAHDWANYPDCLPAIIERLRGVVIESRDARLVMAAHDGAETLHYVDPPYLPETRSPANKYDLKHRMYRHELSRDDHAELLTFLRSLRGGVILSGYASALYDDALSDWRRVEIDAFADGARPRKEILWINPKAARDLDAAQSQGGLFAGRDRMEAAHA